MTTNDDDLRKAKAKLRREIERLRALPVRVRAETIEECARLIDENQETFSETAYGSRRYLTQRKHGNAAGLAYADGIRAIAAAPIITRRRTKNDHER